MIIQPRRDACGSNKIIGQEDGLIYNYVISWKVTFKYENTYEIYLQELSF